MTTDSQATVRSALFNDLHFNRLFQPVINLSNRRAFATESEETSDYSISSSFARSDVRPSIRGWHGASR